MIKLGGLVTLKPITEAPEDRYVSIGFGKYKEKGKEDDENAPTFEKDGNKFVPISTHKAAAKDSDGKKDKPKVNIFKKDKAAKGGDSSAGEKDKSSSSNLDANQIGAEISKSVGIDGTVNVNNNNDIEFTFGETDSETSLFIGRDGDTYKVSVENPYGDDFGDVEQFDNQSDAIEHAKKLAKKYSKELGAKEEPKSDSSLPKSASELDSNHVGEFGDAMDAESGLSGTTDIDYGTIRYSVGNGEGDEPTYSILIGSNDDYGKPDEFRVSLEPNYGNDPAGLNGKVDKTFKTAEEAKKFAAQVAKKYNKEMQMDDSEPKKDGPVKDSSGGRAGNPEVNKAVRKKAEKIGLTPQKLGREEYELRMVQAAHEALTDSNFHSEARKLIAIIEDNPELEKNPANDPNKPGLGEPGYEEWVKGTAWGSKYGESSEGTDELGQAAASEAGWAGKDALDGIAFELKMRGFKDLAAKIQSVFDDEKNESSMRLTKMEFKGKE